MLNIRLSRI